MFKKLKTNYKVINLALVEDDGGIVKYMYNQAVAGITMKYGFTETKEAGIDAVLQMVNSHMKDNTKLIRKSALFEYLDRYFGKNPGFICFENLEVIFSNRQL